jgi:hypothetical protein
MQGSSWLCIFSSARRPPRTTAHPHGNSNCWPLTKMARSHCTLTPPRGDAHRSRASDGRRCGRARCTSNPVCDSPRALSEDIGLDKTVVMALAVSPDATFALSVSADHLIGRYDLTVRRARAGSRPLSERRPARAGVRGLRGHHAPHEAPGQLGDRDPGRRARVRRRRVGRQVRGAPCCAVRRRSADG